MKYITKKGGQNKDVSPSGRKFTAKQMKAYYATNSPKKKASKGKK